MAEVPNYPSNTGFNAAKKLPEEGPRTACVVKDKEPKKSLRLLDVFIAKDVNEIKDYVVYDLVIPKVKETILDTLEMMFYGGQGRNYRPQYTSDGSRIIKKTAYDLISTRNNRMSRSEDPVRVSRRSDTVIYRPERPLSLAEAQRACDDLRWNCERFGKARLEEYYQMIGISPISTDHNWGWTNLDGLNPRRDGIDSWIVPVPNPEPLD